MAANLNQPAGQAPNPLSQFVDAVRQRQATNGYPQAEPEEANGFSPETMEPGPEGLPADAAEDMQTGEVEAPQPSLPEGDEQFVEQTDDGEAAAFQQQLDTYVQSQVQAHVSQMLPALVQQALGEYDEVKRAEARFYKENPDLEPHGDLLELLAQGVEKEMPDVSNEDLLRTVADRARQKLNLVQAGPSLPTGSPMGGRTGNPSAATQEEHQAQMMADYVKFKRNR